MKTTKTYTFYFGTYEQLKEGRCEYDRKTSHLLRLESRSKYLVDVLLDLGKMENSTL